MKPLTKALKLAKVIRKEEPWKTRCAKVHKWHKAIKEMLAG